MCMTPLLFLWLWRNSKWADHFYFLPAKHLSAACSLYLVRLVWFFFRSHRWQWGVGLWRWNPLTFQWKPVRHDSWLSFHCDAAAYIHTSCFPVNDVNTVCIIISSPFIPYSSFPQQPSSAPEICEYILYPVPLKWHVNRRQYFPLSQWFEPFYILNWCVPPLFVDFSHDVSVLLYMRISPSCLPHPPIYCSPSLAAYGHVGAQHTLSDANLEDFHTQ